jgi:5-formyltetrahydrofolate cyclo-ligase
LFLPAPSLASLRRKFRAARRAIDANTQHLHAYAVARHFAASRLPLRSDRAAIYLANDGELDPTPIAQRLLAAGKTVALPVIGADRRLSFYRYEPHTSLLSNRYGIGEPDPRSARKIPVASLAVVFVPLVAFDAAGVRLGMGGGYYDATFAVHGRALLVGLAHEVQRHRQLPHRPWDVRLDIVITERGAAAFSPRGQRYLVPHGDI